MGCLGWLVILVLVGCLINYWYIVIPIAIIYGVVLRLRHKKWRASKFYHVNFDIMDGYQFEQFCADLLKANGFYSVRVTPGSRDRGIDVLASKNGRKYAVQCKCYSSNVGNKAVQEAYSGKGIYHTDIAVVMTNRFFTKQAIADAKRLNVVLWDRNKLLYFVHNAKGENVTEQAQSEIAFPMEQSSQENNLRTVAADKSPVIVTSKPGIGEPDEKRKKMYDRAKGIFPAGTYIVGEDIDKGSYLLRSRADQWGQVSLYASYKKYKEDDALSYNSFKGDYHLSLREDGIFIDVENADIEKL